MVTSPVHVKCPQPVVFVNRSCLWHILLRQLSVNGLAAQGMDRGGIIFRSQETVVSQDFVLTLKISLSQLPNRKPYSPRGPKHSTLSQRWGRTGSPQGPYAVFCLLLNHESNAILMIHDPTCSTNWVLRISARGRHGLNHGKSGNSMTRKDGLYGMSKPLGGNIPFRKKVYRDKLEIRIYTHRQTGREERKLF